MTDHRSELEQINELLDDDFTNLLVSDETILELFRNIYKDAEWHDAMWWSVDHHKVKVANFGKRLINVLGEEERTHEPNGYLNLIFFQAWSCWRSGQEQLAEGIVHQGLKHILLKNLSYDPLRQLAILVNSKIPSFVFPRCKWEEDRVKLGANIKPEQLAMVALEFNYRWVDDD